MYEKIKERYLRNYIREDQLERYVALGVLSAAQAAELRGDRSPAVPGGAVDLPPRAGT